jgi:uncharacterized protein YbjT (DUF2867 family)
VGVILVTGATGNVGRPLVAELLARGAGVRTLSRDPGRADLPTQVVGGDLSDASSLEPALIGVDTVFLLWCQDSASNPRAAIDAIARSASRIVYLSSLSVRDDLRRQVHPMSAIHAEIEAAIRASGVAWTFLRAGTFASNALGWADEIRTTGAVRLPYPVAGRSPVDPADLSAVAAAVLTGHGHDGVTYVPTGPELLTEAERVRILGEATGRPVTCVPIAPEAARREMLRDGLSEELVDAALAYWERIVRHPEPVTDDVERLTGRAATSFRTWAEAHAGAFRPPEHTA